MTKGKREERVRRPQQERSKVTRDAIVEAAARLFAEEGLVATTTNRIADVAGVSVGSLYQYFPNKQAITTALFQRESDRMTQVFLRLLGESGPADLRAFVRAFVRETVSVFEDNAALYRVLFDEVPRVSGLEPTLEIDRRAVGQLRAVLEAGRARLRVRDLDAAAKLVVRAYRYNTMAVFLEPFESDAAREAFVDELTAMIVGYLFGDDDG